MKRTSNFNKVNITNSVNMSLIPSIPSTSLEDVNFLFLNLFLF